MGGWTLQPSVDPSLGRCVMPRVRSAPHALHPALLLAGVVGRALAASPCPETLGSPGGTRWQCAMGDRVKEKE